MLVCSCNFITEADIRQIILGMLDEDCWQLIVPAKVYHALEKRGRCCGCFPRVVDLIIETTADYHQRHHTDEHDREDFLRRLRFFQAEFMPQTLQRTSKNPAAA